MHIGKRKENLFQLLRKKEETRPLDTVNVLARRQRIKKVTWAGEIPVLPRYVTKGVTKEVFQHARKVYSFRSSVTPTFFYTNHLLNLFSTKTDEMKKISR